MAVTLESFKREVIRLLGEDIDSENPTLINGADKVETAARAGKVRLLIHARDSGDDGRRRLDQAWRVGGGAERGMIFAEGRTILSMALGRDNVVHVALTDPAAATRVSHAYHAVACFL